MQRIRTLREAAAIYKSEDPDTKLTYGVLYRMKVAGKLPHRKIGRTTLIDVDSVKEYFKGNFEG